MTEESYAKIMGVIADSPYHQWWSEQMIEDHIDTPLSLGQFVLGLKDDNEVSFFATFAFPEERHIQDYLANNKFPVDGYSAMGRDIWIVDFICLGGMRDIATSFRSLKSLICSMGYKQCFWLRTEKQKLGFHALKE